MPFALQLVAAALLGVVLATVLYPLLRDPVQRVVTLLSGGHSSAAGTMKTVSVEFATDAFPLVHLPASETKAPAGSGGPTDVASADAPPLVAPYATRVVELDDTEGTQNLWLCTLCLN